MLYKKKIKKAQRKIEHLNNKTTSRSTKTKKPGSSSKNKYVQSEKQKKDKQNRKHTTKRETNNASKHSIDITKSIIPLNTPPTSYNELLISNIMSKNDRLKINPYSIFLQSLIMNFNDSNKTDTYNFGISLGKLLYLSSKRSVDHLISDSLQHIADFFENVGNRYVTYTVLPHQIVFHINNDDKIQIGMNTHIFEAGILSGFISSLLHNYINVVEERCRYNESDNCVFVSHITSNYQNTISENELKIFLRSAVSNYDIIKPTMSSSYLLLMFSLLEKKEFSSYAYLFADILGREMRKMIKTEKDKNDQTDFILDGIKLFAVGTSIIKNNIISIRINKEMSKREVIRLLSSFIGGYLNRHLIEVEIRNSNGSYIIKLKR